MKVIRQCEANVELDGPEVVRTYLEPARLLLALLHYFRDRPEESIRDIRNLTKSFL